jgi:hypothetical protein
VVYLIIIVIVFGLIGFMYFTVAYLFMNVTKKLKSSFFYLVLTNLTYLVLGSIVMFLIFRENSDFASNLWKSIPIIFSAGMILFMIGSIKFAAAMNSLKS